MTIKLGDYTITQEALRNADWIANEELATDTYTNEGGYLIACEHDVISWRSLRAEPVLATHCDGFETTISVELVRDEAGDGFVRVNNDDVTIKIDGERGLLSDLEDICGVKIDETWEVDYHKIACEIYNDFIDAIYVRHDINSTDWDMFICKNEEEVKEINRLYPDGTARMSIDDNLIDYIAKAIMPSFDYRRFVSAGGDYSLRFATALKNFGCRCVDNRCQALFDELYFANKNITEDIKDTKVAVREDIIRKLRVLINSININVFNAIKDYCDKVVYREDCEDKSGKVRRLCKSDDLEILVSCERGDLTVCIANKGYAVKIVICINEKGQLNLWNSQFKPIVFGTLTSYTDNWDEYPQGFIFLNKESVWMDCKARFDGEDWFDAVATKFVGIENELIQIMQERLAEQKKILSDLNN